MKLCFNKDELEMQAFVRSFADREIAPYNDSMEKGEFPSAVIAKMGESGLMGIPVPKKYQGLEKSFIAYIMAIHEISKVSAAVGVILSVHTSVGTNPILYFGTDEQKERYIPKLARGEYLGAFALTEPSAGSDAAQLKLKAVKQHDHYILHGSKLFITNGKEADTFIVFARTNDKKGAKGISAFIVEKDTPGLLIGKNERKMGLHGTSTVMLHFEGAWIHESQLLGNEGEGFKVAMANLNTGRIGIAAQALGIAEAAMEYAADHLMKTDQKEQHKLFKIADMATKAEAARLLVYQAASMLEQEVPCVQEVSEAKLFTTKIAREITIDAISLLGMDGVSEQSPLTRYFRDAKVTEIYEGTSEIQRVVIAKQLLQN